LFSKYWGYLGWLAALIENSAFPGKKQSSLPHYVNIYVNRLFM
jgi:hypothetical protein